MIYLKLFLIFFKIGAFTFGGGYAMLPLIQQEVLSQGWMDLEPPISARRRRACWGLSAPRWGWCCPAL